MSPPKPEPVSGTLDLQETLRSKFEQHKKVVVGAGALLAILVVGVILFVTLSLQAKERHWADLLEVTRMPFGDPVGGLEHIAVEGRGQVAPHALLNLAVYHARQDDFDKALEALDRLESEYDDSFLAALPSPDRDLSLIGKLRRMIDEEKAWKDAHTFDPPEVSTERVALVETTLGSFWVGFYRELSEKHVENFVARAKSGAFNGTQVYSIDQMAFRFGGETTRDDDPLDDAEPEGEPEIDPESGRYRIPLERGSVASVSLDEAESAARVLVVTSSFAVPLEKKQTIFGKVLVDRLPGMRALDDIANAKTYSTTDDPAILENADFREIADHPIESIRIERVSIWSDEAIEEGHGWDTSLVKKPEPVEVPEEPGDEQPTEKTPSDEQPDEGASDEPSEETPKEGGEE